MANSSFGENRRSQLRAIGSGEIIIAWHHQPNLPRPYFTLDISECGARIVVDTLLPEGLTGLTLVHRPTGIRIDRSSMVIWSRSVRDKIGNLEQYESGIRFF